MDVVKGIQNYLNKMMTDVSGMKALLLSPETTAVVSSVLTQSQLLTKEVYLMDLIDNPNRADNKALKCIIFVRGDDAGVQSVIDELKNPKYGDYYLYFSSTLKKSSIERLAEADESELVREVQEYYADFIAIQSDLFSLNLESLPFPPGNWDNLTLARTGQGLMAILLALKKKPAIRYDARSPLCKKLAAELSYQIGQEAALFEFRKPETPPILLLLDRKYDPTTPLLLQWTYQAMVHDLFGIQNGRVDLSDLPDIRPEFKQVVLSESDTFYKENMFLNIGDLGASIKTYVDDFQQKHKSTKQINNLEDMKKFVQDYPEFRKLSGNVTKHVTLVSELSNASQRLGLLEASELEQSLACSDNHMADAEVGYSTLSQILRKNAKLSESRKLILVLLYALKYASTPGNMLASFQSILESQDVPVSKIALINAILTYSSSNTSQDLFSPANLLARTKNAFQGLNGIDNVYTQHTPRVVETLAEIRQGRLKEALFPFVDNPLSPSAKPSDVIVYFVGGCTYAEAREIAKLNATLTNSTRFIIGSSHVLSSEGFLKQLTEYIPK